MDNNGIVIIWYPTDKITADSLTKPLIGDKVQLIRVKIMNLKELKLEVLWSKKIDSTVHHHIGVKECSSDKRPKTTKHEAFSQLGRAERTE